MVRLLPAMINTTQIIRGLTSNSALSENAVITDDSESVFEYFAENMGLSVDWIKAHPQALVGTVDEMIDKLLLVREETDISYMVFGPNNLQDLDRFANEVIPELR